MNLNQSDKDFEKKSDEDAPVVRKGRIWTLLGAIVVLAVIILNVFAAVLGDRNLWYIDMTRDKYKSATSTLYTLSDSCISLLSYDAIPKVAEINAERVANGEDEIKVKIVFCADKDFIEADDMMRYVSFTARALEKEFPDAIEVEYINMTKNPSAVQKYKTTTAASIYTSDVIVEFGSEYLVQSIKSFYYIDDTETKPWAYNGEKRLSAMIRALTRAEAPICCITANHGEGLFDQLGNVKEEYSEILKVIEGSGYDIMFIDLERDEIPENCRMMLTFAPVIDFKAYGNLGEGGVSEIEKLDKYLDEANAFFYICDQSSPELPNLEEYLEEWGITVASVDDGLGGRNNYAIKDKVASTDSGVGNVVIGSYVTEGLGATLTEDMRESGYPAKVVFGNATAISPAESYYKAYVAADQETGRQAFNYYRYYRNGVSRNMLDIFTTSASAYAEVGGEQYEIATELSRFKLMTITQETRQVQEDNFTTVNRASYVVALGSTDFCQNEVLSSRSYGNTDVLMSVLRNTGNEVVPTDIPLKAFYDYGVADSFAYRAEKPEVWSNWLIISPAVVAIALGVVVCVRRRYR